MKRKIYDKLKQWKDTENGESALLVQGARRVGKSYVVEEFAKKEYKSYILMYKSKYMLRLIDSRIESYLSASGALCIEGAKWCGKTRHKKSAVPSGIQPLIRSCCLFLYYDTIQY